MCSLFAYFFFGGGFKGSVDSGGTSISAIFLTTSTGTCSKCVLDFSITELLWRQPNPNRAEAIRVISFEGRNFHLGLRNRSLSVAAPMRAAAAPLRESGGERMQLFLFVLPDTSFA
jgi:hypothetical protein